MSIILRELETLADFSAAEELQLNVWGREDHPDPADLMMVVQHEGGLVAGVFQNETLIAYLFGFPTKEPAIQHSHRLAVAESARGLGLAAKLKWYQRDWCLQRGITMVRWTYDPLRAVNANLNINRLGCTVGTYFVDYYGKMAGINDGAPSDRILAEWDLKSKTVAAQARGERLLLPPIKQSIRVPTDFGALLQHDQVAALSERLRVRHEMTEAFASGLRITGFDPKLRQYALS